jgi:hypothetical protein
VAEHGKSRQRNRDWVEERDGTRSGHWVWVMDWDFEIRKDKMRADRVGIGHIGSMPGGANGE